MGEPLKGDIEVRVYYELCPDYDDLPGRLQEEYVAPDEIIRDAAGRTAEWIGSGTDLDTGERDVQLEFNSWRAADAAAERIIWGLWEAGCRVRVNVQRTYFT